MPLSRKWYLERAKTACETALMKEVTTSNSLAQDKAHIKNTIEELLQSISLLENS